MQVKPVNQRRRPALAEPDVETERVLLLQWQRRTHAFAWACGLRLDPVAGRDED